LDDGLAIHLNDLGRLDRDGLLAGFERVLAGDGMVVGVGPVQETDEGVQFDCLVHNTIRGAAGASLLNGELLVDRGYV